MRDNSMPSAWITEERRFAIYARDAFECAWCGCDLSGPCVSHATLDHVRHLDHGNNHESNLLTSCNRCNASRGATPFDEMCRVIGTKQLTRIMMNMSRAIDVEEGRRLVQRYSVYRSEPEWFTRLKAERNVQVALSAARDTHPQSPQHET